MFGDVSTFHPVIYTKIEVIKAIPELTEFLNAAGNDK